ncbi:MAG: hypothetical protein K6G26_12260 [Lachnospiraceae bacterium]|nr:hypothetical protein [Lachnospiraceae bacterium]
MSEINNMQGSNETNNMVKDVNDRKRLEENAKLRKKLIEDMNKEQSLEEFGSFMTSQKKPTRKKFFVTTVVAVLLLAGLSVVLYRDYFTNDSLLRKSKLGMSFDEVVHSEKFLFDSKEYESIGDNILIYNGIKYTNIKGDVVYYFNQSGSELSMIAFKFPYSEANYKALINRISKQYGNYVEEEKSDYQDIKLHWSTKDGNDILFVSVKNNNTIEVDVKKQE